MPFASRSRTAFFLLALTGLSLAGTSAAESKTDAAAAIRVSTCTPWTDIAAGITGLMGGARVAWGDYDNDGDLDILMIGASEPSFTRIARIYRNSGGPNPTFTDINAGLAGVSFGDAAWGDYDNDGDLDIVITGLIDGTTEDTRVYRNNGGANPTFTDIGAGLPGTSYGAVAWGDYDDDGDLDLLLAGQGPGLITRVYRNSGGANPTFTDIGAGLPGVYLCGVAWGDYDNDGDLDIAISGDPGSGPAITRIYRSSGGSNPTFTDINAGLVGVSGRVAWGDYDNDGDLDLLLSGFSPPSTRLTRIYRNSGGASPTFTDIGAGLAGCSPATGVWGDYDNDGDLDILLAGYDGDTGFARVYRSSGGANPTFSDAGAGLTGVADGAAAWGDYDNDGDLDILIAGDSGLPAINAPVTLVYRNGCASADAPPSVPTNLTASGGTIKTFSWSEATDAVTPATGLSYNLRVGTTPGAGDLLSGMASPSTGYRRIVGRGNAGHQTWWRLTVPAGPIYWTVQAVDGAFLGSAFAPVVTTGVEDAARPPAEALGAAPNPFSRSTTVRFGQSRAGHVTLAVHDVAGRRVRTLLDQDLPAGRFTAPWDGTDDQGRAMASGVYVIRLTLGERVETARIGVVR